MFLRRPVLARCWCKANAVHWRREGDYRDFVEWFIAKATTESHQTKTYEDAVTWGVDTDGETLIMAGLGIAEPAAPGTRREQLAPGPPRAVPGARDRRHQGRGHPASPTPRLLAKATGGKLLPIEGGDHVTECRHPVEVNLAIRQFVDPTFRPEPATATATADRGRCSSAPRSGSATPAGTSRSPASCAHWSRNCQVDWLAQDPVTRLLDRARRAASTRPASTWPARPRTSTRESGEHDLHVFQALRTMDEILMANYMVFDDVVRDEHYDLWVGDEAWELDYHLHKNPAPQDGTVRLADRLRRLAADAGRRRSARRS